MKYSILYTVFLLFPMACWSQTVPADLSEWFPFQPENTYEQGVIGMESWLDAPAGKHGLLTLQGDDFVFEDGTPIKFWGTNHSNKFCGPPKEKAPMFADWFAKMGINAVRLHKFTYPDPSAFGDPEKSTRLTDEGWERLDYYMYQLKQKGIYYSWSPIFGHRLVPGDSARVEAYTEVMEGARGRTNALVNFAPDLQQLSIDLLVHMLDHKNPYTGLRYADDPALVSVEFQNEDNIFWTWASKLEACPTYKTMLCRQYSEWLRDKYGSHEKMVEAWGGEQALDIYPDHMTGEHLDKNNLFPLTEFGAFWSGTIEKSPHPQRMLDNARFLYDTQMDFYRRFEKAVRDTGYKGPLVGSCWQAGSGITHYYNLHADYEVGIIDRHNYFGAKPHHLQLGTFPNKSMFHHPGAGLISSGLMSVADRPFVFSEWTVKMPTEWLADGPAIIGVYGMGLQDWDGSFHFNSEVPHFTDNLESGNIYNTDLLTQIGLFPALGRMIARGDVTEGKLMPKRKVHVGSLLENKIGFEESVRQQADVKSLGGDVPVDALVKGRLQLEFTDSFEESELESYQALTEERTLVSNTGELVWHRGGNGENGFFTVETEGTVALCGFPDTRTFELGDFKIRTTSPYAMIFITATEQDKTLAESKSILVTTLARARNSGMGLKFAGEEIEVVEVGGAPLMVEPVEATITFDAGKKFEVGILDHDGRQTGQKVKVKNNTFHLDGAETKAVWYEIKVK